MSYLQNKPHNITDKQAPFAQDIYSSYQMLLNLDEWEKQFGAFLQRDLKQMRP
jgi:hypothetical protein